MASGREQREEDGFRQSKATSAMPHRIRRKLASLIDGPRHQVNNGDKHSMFPIRLTIKAFFNLDFHRIWWKLFPIFQPLRAKGFGPLVFQELGDPGFRTLPGGLVRLGTRRLYFNGPKKGASNLGNLAR